MKYLDTMVTFSEFPDEITLCINISNCPHHCKGCHSPELQKNIGIRLDKKILSKLIESNKGITCVGFMGGDSDLYMLNTLAAFVKCNYKLKVGWYSGNTKIPSEISIKLFDYIKIGPYIEEKGPLNNLNTNQKMFMSFYDSEDNDYHLSDITYKFWKYGKQ